MANLDHTGLSEEVVNQLQQVFLYYPEIESVLLYGSRAKGNYHTGSDIDLTIYKMAREDLDLAKLEVELDDLMLPYSIDINLFSELTNEDLVSHIKRVGIPIYKKTDE